MCSSRIEMCHVSRPVPYPALRPFAHVDHVSAAWFPFVFPFVWQAAPQVRTHASRRLCISYACFYHPECVGCLLIIYHIAYVCKHFLLLTHSCFTLLRENGRWRDRSTPRWPSVSIPAYILKLKDTFHFSVSAAPARVRAVAGRAGQGGRHGIRGRLLRVCVWQHGRAGAGSLFRVACTAFACIIFWISRLAGVCCIYGRLLSVGLRQHVAGKQGSRCLGLRVVCGAQCVACVARVGVLPSFQYQISGATAVALPCIDFFIECISITALAVPPAATRCCRRCVFVYSNSMWIVNLNQRNRIRSPWSPKFQRSIHRLKSGPLLNAPPAAALARRRCGCVYWNFF